MLDKDLNKIFKSVEKIAGIKLKGKDKGKAILSGLKQISKQLAEKNRIQKENEKRVTSILEVIMALAQLNYSKKAPVSTKSDHMDALAMGINMLGEELQSSTISLMEKEVLLKEIHHRVKNNLQVISSLLNLQSENITDKHSLEKFRESQNRVRSMALVHEKLYESKDLSKINFCEYIESFMDVVNRSYNITEGRVKLHVNMDVKDSNFNIDTAIPCALLLNELVSNAFKYAFPDKREGNLYFSFRQKGKNAYQMEVKDDGIGIPKNILSGKSVSLGLQLVDMLAEQINGKITLSSKKGTSFRIDFLSEPERKIR
jgi:two-component sensor histidine kinase